jgi:hypothetical protein
MDRSRKVELFEQIRREYRFGVGTVRGVAKRLGVHRADGAARNRECDSAGAEDVFGNLIWPHCGRFIWPHLHLCACLAGGRRLNIGSKGMTATGST